MHMCAKCGKMSALLILLVGLGFLLRDWGVWSFWNLNWYTAAFLLFGAVKLCKTCCKECREACCKPEEPAKKKR